MPGDFLDSNVLLYLFSQEDATKKAAVAVVGDALRQRSGQISFQVVQEVLNGIFRLPAQPVSAEDARLFLRETLVPLWTVDPSQTLYERALVVHERYRYAFHDALIIAAALESGCTRLLSEDFQDGQRIEGVTIENPFRGLPAR